VVERIDDLAVAVASTTSRMDTLTDAMVTLRGLVNERMGDIGDALTRSQTQFARDLDEAITTVVNRVATPGGTDLGEALDQTQVQVSQDLERLLTRAQGQVTEQLNEALLEARSQAIQEVAEATTDALEHQLAAAINRLEAQADRRVANDDRRFEQTTTSLKAAVTAGEEGARHIDKVVTALSSEVAAIGQRLSDQVDAASSRSLADLAALGEHLGVLVEGLTETNRADVTAAFRRLTNEVMTAVTGTGDESARHAQQVSADIAALSESVADALARVADRLEQLAVNNHDQQDVVEAVAAALDDVAARLDDLDASNRARHDRMLTAVADLRSKRGQAPPVNLEPVTSGLERIETFVEALVDASDDSAEAGQAVTSAVDRLTALEATIADRLGDATTAVVRELTEAAERAANQIRTAAPPVTERSTLAAITRIEGRMAELTRQRDEQDQATNEALEAVEETVSRLASAQAEDLERILDTVERAPDSPGVTAVSLAPGDTDRLDRIEEELRKLSRQPRTAGVAAGIDDSAAEQMANLSNQIENLRRRLAVRGRPLAPALDAATLDAIADAVAARLVPGAATGPPSGSAAKAAPAKRAPAKRAPAKARAKRAPAAPRKATGGRGKPEP
jgi:hypothetical protein